MIHKLKKKKIDSNIIDSENETKQNWKHNHTNISQFMQQTTNSFDISFF